MASKIKNIIIFIVIAAVLILVYVYFFKSKAPEASLTSTSGSPVLPTTNTADTNLSIGKDFLTVLLNVKNIKLDDSIFSDLAFSSLHDSSILLIPDGTEGRPNPFAPIGSDITASAINSLNTNTGITPVSGNPIIPQGSTTTTTTTTTTGGTTPPPSTGTTN
jgi:hypothetical protein